MSTCADPIQWLISTGNQCQDSAALLDKLAGMLLDFDVAPMRINIVQGALHPEVMIKLFIWRSEAGFVDTSKTAQIFESSETQYQYGIVKEVALGNSTFQNPAFLASPLFQVIERGTELIHEPLPKDRSEYTYPILKEYHQQGATDYLALPIQFTNGNRGCLSCVTRKTGGFQPQDVALIRTLMPVLSFVLEIHANHWLTCTLLRTYLGNEPGQRVLSGEIKRGDVNTYQAAIWFSDLRGFTSMSGQLNANDMICLLNEYFELVGQAVKEHKGEVLKFIGDAVLAIFPVNANCNSHQSCAHAFRAAKHATHRLENIRPDIQQRYGVQIHHGVALHYGKVKYGNIGSLDRLDFTVIGQPVNLASRIEGLCSILERELLISAEFFQQVPACHVLEPSEYFRSCGYFSLKGIQQVEEVFQLCSKSTTSFER